MSMDRNWVERIEIIKADYQERYGLVLSTYKLSRILTAKCGRPVQHKTVIRILCGSIPKADIGEAINGLASNRGKKDTSENDNGLDKA